MSLLVCSTKCREIIHSAMIFATFVYRDEKIGQFVYFEIRLMQWFELQFSLFTFSDTNSKALESKSFWFFER